MAKVVARGDSGVGKTDIIRLVELFEEVKLLLQLPFKSDELFLLQNLNSF